MWCLTRVRQIWAKTVLSYTTVVMLCFNFRFGVLVFTTVVYSHWISLLLFDHLLTLIHMQSENGRVAIIRMMETIASRSAQQPGPSGSAEKKPYHYFSSLCNGPTKNTIMLSKWYIHTYVAFAYLTNTLSTIVETKAKYKASQCFIVIKDPR